ncbi:MAG: hypothetical protein WA667_06665, partial [Candidatus Nitrosopolaris sp.]
SAVEECWRQGKDTLLVSKYYPSFTNLKAAITNYYRKKRFNLNIVNYLMRVCGFMLVCIRKEYQTILSNGRHSYSVGQNYSRTT